MIGQISLLVKMMRLKVVVTLWTFLLLGLARHTAHVTSPRLGSALLALGAGYAAATTANDIADIGIDRVNRPRDSSRPLVTGDASVSDLWRTNAIAAGVSVAAAVPLGATGAAIVGTSLLVSYRLLGRTDPALASMDPRADRARRRVCRTAVRAGNDDRRGQLGPGRATFPWSAASSSCSSHGSS